MKKFLKAVLSFLHETGRTRAAAAMARSGNFKEATDLIK